MAARKTWDFTTPAADAALNAKLLEIGEAVRQLAIAQQGENENIPADDTNKSLTAAASADLALTNAAQDVAGATITLRKPGWWLITAHFYFLASAPDGLVHGILSVGGAAQTTEARIFGSMQTMVPQTWRVKTTSNSVIAKLQAYSAVTGTSKCLKDHTTITAVWVEPLA
jgi:hypothetical protein